MHNRLLSALLLVALAMLAGSPGVAQDYMAGPGYQPMYPATTPQYAQPYARDAYGVVPRPPSQPIPTIRPHAWPAQPNATQGYRPNRRRYRQPPMNRSGMARQPGMARPYGAMPYGPQASRQRGGYAMQAPPVPQRELLQSSRILGRVGSEIILACEVMAGNEEIVEKNKGQMPAEQIREMLMQQKLKQLIETKLIFCDARNTIPKESFPDVDKTLGEQFDEQELEKMMKRAKVGSRTELDEKLRTMGTSLDREKRAFMQRTLARQWIGGQLDFDKEVTHDQMLEYYRMHGEDFDHSARARWEELSVRFSKYPGKAEAGAAIAGMGNQVAAGMPWAQVAATQSSGSTASEGGQRDWTPQDSLANEVVDRALFSLPVRQLSPILESENGFHIVRVIEREEAYRTPFTDAQVKIKKKIQQGRTKEQLQAYIAKLRKTIPVWTIYDDQDAVSGRPVSHGSEPSRR